MFIRLEPGSGVPITRQIADQIRLLCATGGLRPGDRLASVRELARQLTVNQNTILRVYERLTAEGLLERRHGNGTFVAGQQPAGQLEAQRGLLQAEVDRVVRRAGELGLDDDQLQRLIRDAIRQLKESDDE